MKAYILKISFQQIEPEVWRRVVLPAGATFKRLHDTIQEVTNFQDYHSYAFETKDLYVTNNEELVLEFKGREFAGRVVKSPSSVKIDEYLERESSMTYNYDFGDDWRLDVELENTVDDYYFGYPTILAGEGTAPPEDVGGVPGYTDFLAIYENRSHPEFLSMYGWAEQQRYVPFDLDRTNDFLKFIKYKKTEWDHIQHKNYAVLQDAYRSTDIIDVTNIPNRDEMIQYAIASANLYGMIGIPQFLKTYNEQNNTMLGSKTLMALVNDKEVEQKLAEGFVYFYRGAFLQDSIEIEDYDPFMSNVLGKPYYVPEKQELLRYVDEFYYEKTQQQDVLIRELAKDFFDGSKVLAGAEVSEFVLNVQVAPDEVNALVHGFLQAYKWDGREQLNDYVQMLMHVVNTTRLWENRGHTAEELFEMEKHFLQPLPDDAVIENGVKVGRNDPCPCGSGKKYKKCCGKG